MNAKIIPIHINYNADACLNDTCDSIYQLLMFYLHEYRAKVCPILTSLQLRCLYDISISVLECLSMNMYTIPDVV